MLSLREYRGSKPSNNDLFLVENTECVLGRVNEVIAVIDEFNFNSVCCTTFATVPFLLENAGAVTWQGSVESPFYMCKVAIINFLSRTVITGLETNSCV